MVSTKMKAAQLFSTLIMIRNVAITGINNILKIIKQKIVILHCNNNISNYYCFYSIVDEICCLGERDFFRKQRITMNNNK